MEPSNRRRFERTRAVYRLDVSQVGGAAQGYVVDASMGGIQIRHDARASFRAAEAIRIDFPRWLGLGPGIELGGHVAWYREAANDRIECGFSFGSLTRAERALLGEMIDRLAEAIREDGFAQESPAMPRLDDEVSLDVFL